MIVGVVLGLGLLYAGMVAVLVAAWIAWRDLAMKEGFQQAVRRRDEPWGDYSARER